MSSLSSAPSNDDATGDPRPAGQRARAEHAHLDANDPAKNASSTPDYGNFGKADEAETPISKAGAGGNDGSNDNPDEFSEFRDPKDTAADNSDINPADQRGHVDQNQAPDQVRAAHNADVDVQRAAWSDDDPRYAGGHAKATWTEENSKEHDSND